MLSRPFVIIVWLGCFCMFCLMVAFGQWWINSALHAQIEADNELLGSLKNEITGLEQELGQSKKEIVLLRTKVERFEVEERMRPELEAAFNFEVERIIDSPESDRELLDRVLKNPALREAGLELAPDPDKTPEDVRPEPSGEAG